MVSPKGAAWAAPRAGPAEILGDPYDALIPSSPHFPPSHRGGQEGEPQVGHVI